MSETLLTVTQAAKIPPSRSGKRGVHPATIWRWALRGCSGIRLETVVVGGIRYTSRESLDRFIVAVTAAADGTQAPQVTANAGRISKIEAAERELAAAGV